MWIYTLLDKVAGEEIEAVTNTAQTGLTHDRNLQRSTSNQIHLCKTGALHAGQQPHAQRARPLHASDAASVIE